MIETKGLEFSYNTHQSFVFPDLYCGANEKLLILGKSGVGKSTLLHLLGGLIKPSKGAITIQNTDITALKSTDLDAFRGDNIGIIFQQNHFIESLNVLENVTVAQSMIDRPVDVKKAMALLDALNIAHKSNSKIRELSQGERQRVAIARACINDPKVILADEPTSALDDDHCLKVFDLLESMAKNISSAFLIVTHDNRLKDQVPNQMLLAL
ncbi:MAG: ATP-binding cassette domain-containing protein [Saprospiraceae bacterium]